MRFGVGQTSKNLSWIYFRATKPFAILVEEASEVLEPLLFACLGSTTTKLELIGDHLQLKPSIMNKFQFEVINKVAKPHETSFLSH
jgi:superfamily I DNA and/or RNA helicase